MSMLKDFYVSYEVLDDDGEIFFTGGQNVAAYDGNDARHQVEEMFSKYGSITFREIEQIEPDEV